LTELLRFLDELLDVSSFDDYGPNGLQVPGREKVSKVVTGVSAQLELFERAASAGADLVLVHHGLFWNADPRALTPVAARRLLALLSREMSLAAYHLPLDAHPEVGNNALLAAGLGCAGTEPFGVMRGRPIGVCGRFPADGLSPSELARRVHELTGREPLAFNSGPPRIRSIGIVSGGGGHELGQAIADGLDAFLTGEPEEPAMGQAREGGIHFLAAGHYATETFGVRRLGELLAERFGIEHEFIDLPNPV
jgi:dinuclear metal center YbgI/SA1388 family protein